MSKLSTSIALFQSFVLLLFLEGSGLVRLVVSFVLATWELLDYVGAR